MTLLFRLLLLTTISVSSVQAAPKIKCWENNEGIRECGNAIPPEYAQQKHKEMNKHGVTVSKHERAKTQAELDKEDQLAEQDAARKEQARKQAASDQTFLNTFSSEDDIVLVRDGKLSAIRAEIKLRESQSPKLQKSYEKLLSRAADQERKGKTPSEKLLSDLENLKSQINNNKNYIQMKHKEQNLVQAEAEADLKRFRTLNAEHASR